MPKSVKEIVRLSVVDAMQLDKPYGLTDLLLMARQIDPKLKTKQLKYHLSRVDLEDEGMTLYSSSDGFIYTKTNIVTNKVDTKSSTLLIRELISELIKIELNHVSQDRIDAVVMPKLEAMVTKEFREEVMPVIIKTIHDRIDAKLVNAEKHINDQLMNITRKLKVKTQKLAQILQEE